MTYFIIKALVSGLIIAAVTTLAEKSPVGGALLKSLPITSFLVFFIMYYEGRTDEQMAEMSKDIFILVIPSLILFASFPLFLARGLGFYVSLGIATALMVVAYLMTLRLFMTK